jgi:triacylglycerol lipase
MKKPIRKRLTENELILKRLRLSEYPQPDIILLKKPVLFCHGYGAIGHFLKPSLLHDPCMLAREHGVIAFAPNVAPYGRIETRAEGWVKILRKLKEQYGFTSFNVVAHSMGGLDMRYAISKLGADELVDSLTTISSPHRGTFLAELVLKTPESIRDKVSDIIDWFGNRIYPDMSSDTRGSVEQLTRSYVQEVFNPDVKDVESVKYFSYSAASGKGTDFPLNPIYYFQNSQIYEKEGINDSYISVESAKWGEYMGMTSISHLEQINVSVPKSRQLVYEEFWTSVLRNLSDRGF